MATTRPTTGQPTTADATDRTDANRATAEPAAQPWQVYQDAADAPAATEVPEGETRFFAGTITKINRNGDEVMSDHLEPGETLRREVTDRYSTVKR